MEISVEATANEGVGAPKWTQGHEPPGKLSELQRDYILAGASFLDGQPLPFNDMMIPYLGRTSFLGLVKRGFYSTSPNHRAMYYLTAKGYRAARAILAISGRVGHYRIAEIDSYMADRSLA